MPSRESGERHSFFLPAVAFIDEPRCIGCARCLDVCPTDAIVGANKFLHTVLPEDCTGCEKCLPVCPTDCILIQPRQGETAGPKALAVRWRRRVQARKGRLEAQRLATAEARKRRQEQLRKR